MKIVESFEPNKSFWEDHAQLAAAGPFKSLYDNDKTKKKEHSSKLMWTVALIWDRNSKYYNLPEIGEESKIDLLFADIYGDLKYYYANKELITRLRDFYLKIQETPAQRSLREIEDKLFERTNFLRNTPYTLGDPTDRGGWVGNTAVIIDKMMGDTKKIYDVYDAALKIVAAESNKDDDVAKGGGELSATDKGEI